eukprot:365303-Chlamydomonas_euryale.AAC.24
MTHRPMHSEGPCQRQRVHYQLPCAVPEGPVQVQPPAVATAGGLQAMQPGCCAAAGRWHAGSLATCWDLFVGAGAARSRSCQSQCLLAWSLADSANFEAGGALHGGGAGGR